jgi:hypothetical protein
VEGAEEEIYYNIWGEWEEMGAGKGETDISVGWLCWMVQSLLGRGGE